jgi:hypothetical protein
MTDIKEEIKDKAEAAKDVAKDVEEELETVAHNTVHPEDETDAEAEKRQPFMPIAGVIVAGIILFAAFAYFFM